MHSKPTIEVAKALPKHALAIWEIYFYGRIAAQAHGDLSKSDVVAEFRDPASTMIGRTTEQWREMIMDKSGVHAVFNSFNVSDDVKPKNEMPVGIVRASEIDGVRYLNNLYVDRPGQGHGTALYERVKEHFNGQEFKFRVAEYNDRGIAFYEGLGCVASETSGLGYEMQGVYVPQIEMISPAA